ncbi:RNA methyltransferase [Lewinellaceae bacterium SD302]|nr:RNA methyltransferase [Lewinellaceae bacterium SD302]
MPKFYAAQVAAVAEALEIIFNEGKYADRVIAQVLKADKRRGSKDRAFIAEQTYEVVRHYRRLAELAGGEPKTRKDWWRLIGIRMLLDGEELPAWKEWEGLDAVRLQKENAELEKQLCYFASLPDWLDELGRQELGDEWEPTAKALNQPADVILRANRLKTDPAALQIALREDGIETDLLSADGLRVTKRRNLFRTRAFREGLFEVQDFSSQQAAPALDVAPGMSVIDACAGAGGKTLHLAALMENKGRVISLDTEAWKLKELKKRAARNGVQNVETRAIESSKTIKRLYGKADRLLLDVPCSGLGVLRRNPDAKWKLSPEFIERLRGVQREILQRYPKMVKPGGKMVYATCSVLPSENDAQLDHFLNSEAGADWTLIDKQTFLPQRDGFDGFFVSRLEKRQP